MIETVTETGETVRYLTPPEYIKLANARDHRTRHDVDLHHFVAWLQGDHGLMITVSRPEVDALITAYLDSLDADKGSRP